MSSVIGSGFVDWSSLQNYQPEGNRTPTQDLGKDEFLTLLAVQMSNQDPLEPMQDSDFIAQMAQFSALEQMQQLNQSFGTQQAYTLIGKNIVATLDDNTQVAGTVTGVIKQNNTEYLQVGTYTVPLAKVEEIYDTGHEANSLVAQSGYLVGKHIEAEIPVDRTDIVTGESVTQSEKVSGVVEAVLVKNFTVYVKLKGTDGKEVPVSYITKITDTASASADGEEEEASGTESTEKA